MVLQVREAHADQADFPPRNEDLPKQHLAQDQDRLEIRGVDLQAPGSRVDLEIRIFRLERHRAKGVLLMAQLFVKGLHQGLEFRPERLVARDVVLERRLRADRLRWTARFHDLSCVATHRDIVDILTERTEQLYEILTIVLLYVADRLQADLLEPIGGLGTDAQDLPDGERSEEFHDVVRKDDGEPIGLFEIGGDLRGCLRRGDADGAGESLLLAERGLELHGEFPSPVVVAATTGRHIEVALLDPGGLEVVGEPPQEFHDLAAHTAIELEVRGDEDGVGAQPNRLDTRHRRPHAEFPRFVARGEDDASGMLARIGPDDDRLPFELRILADFHRSVEGVHVHMEQHSVLGHGWGPYSERSASERRG